MQGMTHEERLAETRRLRTDRLALGVPLKGSIFEPLRCPGETDEQYAERYAVASEEPTEQVAASDE